jgi:dTDP-4-dehydrorhamnose reductase
MKVLILGASGMLGHRLVDKLSDFDLIAPTREEYEAFDSLDRFGLKSEDVIINCIGIIPQKNTDPDLQEKINSDFPHFIKNYPQTYKIQIATDCAFSGKDGWYSEHSKKDASDSYGVSKIKGEVKATDWMNLRTSIIGSELTGKKSLFEWVKNQPRGATIYGFINHYWNGVTTDAFAEVVRGLLEQNYFIAGTQHLIPLGWVTKYELIMAIAERLGRDDLTIIPKITEKVDRRLSTTYPAVNDLLWQQAGYKYPPSIYQLISSMQVE